MKTIVKRLAFILAPALLLIALGCKSKPAVVAPEPESRNLFLGNWEGKAKNGDAYIIKFMSNLKWESHVEEAGALLPHYKGTYEPEGSRARLKITEEADLKTMGWRPERGSVPVNVSANISGNVLRLGNILTDLELKKR